MSASVLMVSRVRVGRSVRRATLALLLTFGVVGCSNDSGSEGAAVSRTTTEVDATASTTTSGEAASTSTTVSDDPTTTGATEPADPNAPPPQDYAGVVDGQDGDTTISFVRGAKVSSVEVRGLEVTCEPIDNTGATRTETMDLSFPDVVVAEDGSVEVADPDDDLSPSLTGVFSADGTFTGSIFLSFERDGYACGGDYPFTADPA